MCTSVLVIKRKATREGQGGGGHGGTCRRRQIRRAPTAPRTTSAACRRRSPPGLGSPLGTRPAHGPTPLRLPPCSLATAPRWQIAIARPSWPAQKLSQKSEIGVPRREEGLLGGGYACSADRGLRRWARCLSCLFLLPQELGEHIFPNFEVACFAVQILR